MTEKRHTAETGLMIGARFRPALVDRLDEWRRRQRDLPGRTEALRRLLERALDADGIPPAHELAPPAPEKLNTL